MTLFSKLNIQSSFSSQSRWDLTAAQERFLTGKSYSGVEVAVSDQFSQDITISHSYRISQPRRLTSESPFESSESNKNTCSTSA